MSSVSLTFFVVYEKLQMSVHMIARVFYYHIHEILQINEGLKFFLAFSFIHVENLAPIPHKTYTPPIIQMHVPRPKKSP